MKLCPWLIMANEGTLVLRGRARLPPHVPLPTHTKDGSTPIVWRLAESGVLRFKVSLPVKNDDDHLEAVRLVEDTVLALGGTLRIDSQAWTAREDLDDRSYLPCGGILYPKTGIVTGDGCNPNMPALVERSLVAVFGAERFRLGAWGRNGEGDWQANFELLDGAERPPLGEMVPFNALTLDGLPNKGELIRRAS